MHDFCKLLEASLAHANMGNKTATAGRGRSATTREAVCLEKAHVLYNTYISPVELLTYSYYGVPGPVGQFQFCFNFQCHACLSSDLPTLRGREVGQQTKESSIRLSLTSLFRQFALLIQRNHGPATRLSVHSRPAHLHAHYRSQLDWPTGLCNLSRTWTGRSTRTPPAHVQFTRYGSLITCILAYHHAWPFQQPGPPGRPSIGEGIIQKLSTARSSFTPGIYPNLAL